MRKFRNLAVVVALIAALPLIAGEGKIRKKAKGTKGSYVAVLDEARRPVTKDVVKQLAKEYGLKITAVWEDALQGFAFDAPEAAAEALSKSPVVKVVEEDEAGTPECMYQTPQYSRCADGKLPWQVDRMDGGLDNKFTSCNTYFGRGVKIYIVDSDIKSTHHQLLDRVYATSRVMPGIDFVGDGRGTEDCFYHGTAVASMAAGLDAGMGKDAWVIPVRITGCQPGDGKEYSRAVSAFNWIYQQQRAFGGSAIANISYIWSSGYSLDAAIDTLVWQTDTFVTAAAGNQNGSNACERTPAGNPRVFAVGASRRDDYVATFSNLGGCVAVFAPGNAIGAAGINYDGEMNCNPGWSGTSFSAPFAAGLASRYMNIPWKPSDLKQKLINDSLKGILQGIPTHTAIGASTPNRLLFPEHLSCATIACPEVK